MLGFILKKILGTQNERFLKKIQPIVDTINGLEPQIHKLTDSQLKEKTPYFKKQLEEGKSLDDILPEAFAVVREVGRRTLNMRHFDVQLIGGIVLHRGLIAEMATGEGKTLVATLAAYLNGLTGKGVHIVTVNDYLARRDREWMGPIYKFLGLSVGTIQMDMPPDERKQAYVCDITYGTNNEFGFDYLRDNMATSTDYVVQREFHYAIVDEVDSILIDEARTPLIISGPSEISTKLYYNVDKIIKHLEQGEKNEQTKDETGDFIVDEKNRSVSLTEEGEKKAAQLLNIKNLHDIAAIEYRHHVLQAIKAHSLFKRDVDYVVKDRQVIIVDEFTGRLMPGRRWSDGLHQAVEAKENVPIESENQTLATVTFQNYFKMYKKLAGMTGTALTEATEFHHIYKLDVVSVPTNKLLKRENMNDLIYKTKREKFEAVVNNIKQLHKEGRPVLVGTISIDTSELLSRMLKTQGIPHKVLNAKYHEQEAHIVAQAGRYGSVTIATNMAGRGTDILLGGNPKELSLTKLRETNTTRNDISEQEWENLYNQALGETQKEHENVIAVGGLHVLGTERHESRRIDNQLRGRSGRQGDPGSSQFFVSLEDDLMRIFGSDRIKVIMDRFGMEHGEPIQSPLVTRAIETAQKRVESQNFEIRKHLLQYDNVMNRQREIIYAQRKKILTANELQESVNQMIEDMVDDLIKAYTIQGPTQEWDLDALERSFKEIFWLPVKREKISEINNPDLLYDYLLDLAKKHYQQTRSALDSEEVTRLEQMVMLQVIDGKWKDHLYSMDHLREGIGLRAYGQRDPLVEYTNEGFSLFEQTISTIKSDTLQLLFIALKGAPEDFSQSPESVFSETPMNTVHKELAQFRASAIHQEHDQVDEKTLYGATSGQPYRRSVPKVGRNDPCPCGSGKKYKKCCGKNK